MTSNSPNVLIAEAVHTGQTNPPPRLNLHVIFTNPAGTRCALSATEKFGEGLDICVNLVVAQVVPYPLPLDEPDISRAFTTRHLLQLVAAAESDIRVRVQLCRDRTSAILAALPPRSIVLIGDRGRRWWPGPGERLARRLRRDGHKVILIDSRHPSQAAALVQFNELQKHEYSDTVHHTY